MTDPYTSTWDITVTGAPMRSDQYYNAKGPVRWQIDDNGHLHIIQTLEDGVEITIATHLGGTFNAVSQEMSLIELSEEK